MGDDIDRLQTSVAGTLQRAHARTRAGRRPAAHARVACIAPSAKHLKPYPVEEALEEQQAICEELRQEIDRARSRRRRLENKVQEAKERRDLVEQSLEVNKWRIEHAHKRRVELEQQLERHRKRLQGTIDSRKAATRALLETHERVAGLAARLKNAE